MGGKPFEVTAPDPYTVVIKTPSPNASLVDSVANVRIMPKHVLEEAFKKGDFAAAYNVGTPPDNIVTSGSVARRAVRAGREDGPRAKSVFLRRRQEQ